MESQVTPVREDLYEIDASSERLSEEAGKTFHSRVAKLLYMALRTGTDILVAVSFLTYQVGDAGF